MKKWAEDLNTHFFEEDIQMANRYMKRCSISVTISEIQIETTIRYHPTPVRMAIINKTSDNKLGGEAVEKYDPSFTAARNVNWYSHYGKQYGASSKN